MSTRSTLRAVSLACVLLAAPSRATGQPRPVKADSIALFDTIARHDSIVFAAYNRCDLPLLGSYFTPDLEFYHDQTGLMRGRRATVKAVRFVHIWKNSRGRWQITRVISYDHVSRPG